MVLASEDSKLMFPNNKPHDFRVHNVPLLRRVWLKDNKQNIIYHMPYDVPLRMGQFQDVHIYINDSQGKQASFIRDTVSVTLHLKKHHFPLN